MMDGERHVLTPVRGKYKNAIIQIDLGVGLKFDGPPMRLYMESGNGEFPYKSKISDTS